MRPPLRPLDTITVSMAARMAGVSYETVRRWCDEGRIPAFKLIGRWRIPRREFAEWLDRVGEAAIKL